MIVNRISGQVYQQYIILLLEEHVQVYFNCLVWAFPQLLILLSPGCGVDAFGYISFLAYLQISDISSNYEVYLRFQLANNHKHCKIMSCFIWDRRAMVRLIEPSRTCLTPLMVLYRFFRNSLTGCGQEDICLDAASLFSAPSMF